MAKKNKKRKSQLSLSLADLGSWIRKSSFEKNNEMKMIKESNEQEIYDANYTAFKESLLERLFDTLENKNYKEISHILIRKEEEKFLTTLVNDKSFTYLYNIKINKDASFTISIKTIFQNGEVDKEENPSELLEKSIYK